MRGGRNETKILKYVCLALSPLISIHADNVINIYFYREIID